MKLDFKAELISEILRRNCKLSEKMLQTLDENELKVTLDEIILRRK